MTLREAQKQYPDAVSWTMQHKANSVTTDMLEKWANQTYSEPVKILYVKVGKTSSRYIVSKMAYIEECRQLSLTSGKEVKMVNCMEAKIHDGKIWTISFGPQLMCSDWVVWLEGYSGAFCCEFWKK